MGSNDSRGVLIAFVKFYIFSVEKETKDSKRRILMPKIIIQNSKYLLINLYNANTEQQQVDTLEDVSSMLDQIELESEYKLIIKLVSLAKFKSIKQKLDLCDMWRIKNPNSRRFTYRSKSSFFNTGSIIFSFLLAFRKTLSRSIFLRL